MHTHACSALDALPSSSLPSLSESWFWTKLPGGGGVWTGGQRASAGGMSRSLRSLEFWQQISTLIFAHLELTEDRSWSVSQNKRGWPLIQDGFPAVWFPERGGHISWNKLLQEMLRISSRWVMKPLRDGTARSEPSSRAPWQRLHLTCYCLFRAAHHIATPTLASVQKPQTFSNVVPETWALWGAS